MDLSTKVSPNEMELTLNEYVELSMKNIRIGNEKKNVVKDLKMVERKLSEFFDNSDTKTRTVEYEKTDYEVFLTKQNSTKTLTCSLLGDLINEYYDGDKDKSSKLTQYIWSNRPKTTKKTIKMKFIGVKN